MQLSNSTLSLSCSTFLSLSTFQDSFQDLSQEPPEELSDEDATAAAATRLAGGWFMLLSR